MIEAGMDVARLNFSHGSHEQHAETAELVRDAANRAGRPVALLQDLPGPKLRIGPLVEGTVELKVGDKVVFECGRDDGPGDARRMSISWAGLPRAIDPGEVLYLAGGCAPPPCACPSWRSRLRSRSAGPSPRARA
jgi:pyruvate kinase